MLTVISHHLILHMPRNIFPEDFLNYILRERNEADKPVVPQTVLFVFCKHLVFSICQGPCLIPMTFQRWYGVAL